MTGPSSPLADPALSKLRAILRDLPRDTYALLHDLIDSGCADLPCPGAGRTLARWQMLAEVARHDLALAKLYESHADALAILHELGRDALAPRGGLWAVWCAEPPDRRVRVVPSGTAADAVRLHGTKAWCSGAAHVGHALLSAWDADDRPVLVAVRMDRPGVRVTGEGWHAVGMADTASVDVVFDAAPGCLVGGPGAYVERPGFMHGAAGIAACWYGAAQAIGTRVAQSVRQREDDPHALAHLGAIDVALAQARALLRAAAAEIDARDGRDACAHAVRRARLAVEAAAETVLRRAPRAVGAGPLCKDIGFARLMADLPVFIRQSHAERDLAAHGHAVSQSGQDAAWTL
ncbi:hypothetical protein PIGHUM_02511 [Pigmentiphaga humi]|uniref:Acyl-CoA dehydrogenase/oxidase C-terminal domain-containing protein n=1 Tax=Pigmentiphaga humi TaxID=2478468 RepID=A0A3P4B2C4_9BURK|nr:acyl-CoA dehydrogenase family protein [Pigmentiphaga humi]VCU70439.1 hypothetical protein PIGHUM_02511 [Pigmentiphaga humi]